jgi:hypothetical protein
MSFLLSLSPWTKSFSILETYLISSHVPAAQHITGRKVVYVHGGENSSLKTFLQGWGVVQW